MRDFRNGEKRCAGRTSTLATVTFKKGSKSGTSEESNDRNREGSNILLKSVDQPAIPKLGHGARKQSGCSRVAGTLGLANE